MDEVEVLRANESPEGDSSEGTTIKKRIAVIEGALGLIGILGIVAYVYMKPSTGRIVGGVMRIPHPHGRVRHGPGRMQGMGSVDASRRRPSLKERRCRRSFPDAINGRGASGTGALALVVVIPFGDGIVSVGHYVIVPSDGSEGVHPPVFAVDDLLGWLVHVEDLQDRVLEVILDVSGAELSELFVPSGVVSGRVFLPTRQQAVRGSFP